MKRYAGIMLAAIIFSGSCQQKPLSKEGLQQYMNDPVNGLLKTDVRDKSEIQLLYQPCELLFSEELKSGDNSFSCDSILYLSMNLARNNQEIETAFAGDPAKFGGVVRYLSGDISKDIALETANLKLPPGDVHYARAFGAAQHTSLLLIFYIPMKQIDRDFKVIFSDSMLGTGTHEFQFKLKDIDNLPPIML